MEENHVNIYDHTIADNRFNELEMSHNFSSMREPKFCFFIPIAKGVCCGFISLKIALMAIALLDITIGIAAMAIGIMMVSSGEL